MQGDAYGYCDIKMQVRNEGTVPARLKEAKVPSEYEDDVYTTVPILLSIMPGGTGEQRFRISLWQDAPSPVEVNVELKFVTAPPP